MAYVPSIPAVGNDISTDLGKIKGNFDAIFSTNAGSTRPTYLPQYGTWLDTTGAPWLLKLFDGSDDIIIGSFDTTNNVFTPYYAGSPIGLPIGYIWGLNISNSASGANTKIDVVFQALTLLDGSSVPYSAGYTSVTIDASLSGAINRLDTGTLAANTWYYILAISNGSTTAGLITAFYPSPTMPSGYTYKRVIGAVRTGAASHFNEFVQMGNKVIYAGDKAMIQVTSASTAWNDLDVSYLIPILSTRGLFSGKQSSSATTSGMLIRKRGAIDSTGKLLVRGSSYAMNGPIECDTDVNQYIQYYLVDTATVDIYVNGFILDI